MRKLIISTVQMSRLKKGYCWQIRTMICLFFGSQRSGGLSHFYLYLFIYWSENMTWIKSSEESRGLFSYLTCLYTARKCITSQKLKKAEYVEGLPPVVPVQGAIFIQIHIWKGMSGKWREERNRKGWTREPPCSILEILWEINWTREY